MPSEAAKRVAGTYIPDALPGLPTVRAWVTQECRSGVLAARVKSFCEAQPEILEPSSVMVESITDECIQCRIPCRCYDHEASGTFDADVRFSLDPRSGICRRA